MIQPYQPSNYYGRVLNSSQIFKLQQLQVDLQTIVDITNHKNSNTSEEVVNYICNSLDEGLNVLFEIRNQLTGV